MSAHTFLSPEWMAAVQEIRLEHSSNRRDSPGLSVNATITNVPFEPEALELHSSHGPVAGWRTGHDPRAKVSMAVDYHLARELAMDPTLTVLEQAADSGALAVRGDVQKLARWWHARTGNPVLVELDEQVRAVTA